MIATMIGDRRFNHQLGNPISAQSLSRERKLYEKTIQALARIPRQALSPADQLTYDILEDEVQLRLAGIDFPEHLLPVNQLFTTLMVLPILGSGSGPQLFKRVEDYRKFLQRAGEFGGG